MPGSFLQPAERREALRWELLVGELQGKIDFRDTPACRNDRRDEMRALLRASAADQPTTGGLPVDPAGRGVVSLSGTAIGATSTPMPSREPSSLCSPEVWVAKMEPMPRVIVEARKISGERPELRHPSCALLPARSGS